MPGSRRVAALVVALLVGGAPVAATLVGASGAGGNSGHAPTTAAVDSSATVAAHTANNTTHHEDPDTVEESGSLSDVSGWLAGYLADRLANSTVQVSQSQYEQAESLLGEAFGERVEQLVDVTGETETETDDRVADRLQAMRDRQRRFINRTQTYREVLAEYREARRNGNTDRARRLARRLQNITDRIQGLSRELQTDYATVGNVTGESMNRSIRVVETVTTNISNTTTNVVTTVFVGTRLTLSVPSRELSFRDPWHLSGRLVTENGSAITDQTVTLRIGGQRVVVTTNDTGWFATTYRPTTLPLDAQAVTVRFVPDNTSRYLGANASLPVTVAQVRPSLSLVRVSEVVRFGDTVLVRGRVTVEDIGARGVPVVVTVGGVPIGRTVTDPDGGFTLRAPLPAGVPVGAQPVTARVALTDAALAAVNTSGVTEVRRTDTTLSINATDVDGPRVRVTGQLTTVDGTPIADEVVTVVVGGARVTVTTTATGRYATTVEVSALAEGERQTVEVLATFDAAGTNLASTTGRTMTTVRFEAGPPNDPVRDGPHGLLARILAGDLPLWAWGLLAVLGLGLLAGVGALMRSGPEPTPEPEPAGTAATAAEGSAPATPLLDQAEAMLREGDTEAAVRQAFTALRSRVGSQGASALTHWEFYTRASEDFDAEDRALLEGVVESYERAVYAPTGIEGSAAETLLKDVATLVERHRGT